MASSSTHPSFCDCDDCERGFDRQQEAYLILSRAYRSLQRHVQSIYTAIQTTDLKVKGLEEEEAKLKDYYTRLGRLQVLDEYKLGVDEEKASLDKDYPSPPELHAVLNKEWCKITSLSNPDQLLPDDIVRDILLRLSPEDLVRCQVVSIEWMAMIRSSEFVVEHVRRTKATPGKRMLMTVQGTSRVCVTLDETTFAQTSGSLRQLGEIRPLSDTWCIISYIDGLFLLRRGTNYKKFGTLKLWNPALRKTRNLSAVPFLAKRKTYGLVNLVPGLGYDAESKYYKVVVLIFQRFWLDRVAVFSVKTFAWTLHGTDVEFRWRPSLWFEEPCCFKGELKFLCHDDSSDVYTISLVSCTLSTGVIQIKSLPAKVYSRPVGFLKVVVIDNGSTLAISNFLAEMWVMQELAEGNVEWVRQYTFDLPIARVIHVTPNNDILLQPMDPRDVSLEVEALVLCNLGHPFTRSVVIRPNLTRQIYYISEYVPSLLLL